MLEKNGTLPTLYQEVRTYDLKKPKSVRWGHPKPQKAKAEENRMAIYHLSTKPVKRSSGRSATASSAYRAGVELTDERTGTKHDYTKRGGVVTADCFAIQNNKKVSLSRGELWNKAEQAENRKDARTAREIVINLPHELDKDARIKLVDDFAQDLAKKYNCGVDYAVHLPDKEGDQRNHHAHILMTTRAVELDQNGNIELTDKTSLELSNRKLKELNLPKTQEQIKSLRAEWAELTNERLAQYGIDARIDHRSFEEQGIDKQATVKMGWRATALERRGIKTDVGDLNRQIKADNAQRADLRAELSAFKEAQAEIELIKEQAQGMQDFKSEYEQYKQQLEQERQQQAELAKQQELEQRHHNNDRGFEQ